MASFFAAKPPPLCLPHWGRGTAPAVDRALSFIVDLRRSFPLFFIPLEPYPARSARHLPHAGKVDRVSGVRVLSQTTRLRRSFPLSFIPLVPYPARSARHLPRAGKVDRVSGVRVLSQTTRLRRSFPLSFIPLVPYPARSARHLPRAGKALSVVILFLHISCIRFDNARKAASSYRSLPHWGRGTAQRWIGCSRLPST